MIGPTNMRGYVASDGSISVKIIFRKINVSYRKMVNEINGQIDDRKEQGALADYMELLDISKYRVLGSLMEFDSPFQCQGRCMA